MPMYYVWPNGTIQSVEAEGSAPYEWLSDNYHEIEADDEDEALLEAKARGFI